MDGMSQEARDGGAAMPDFFQTIFNNNIFNNIRRGGIKSVSTNLISLGYLNLEYNTFSHSMEWQ
jgi:hypothetical protein